MMGGLRTYALVLALNLICSPALAADEPTLLRKLEAMAATGNGEALYHIGMSYHVGLGVPPDRQKAFDFFRRAAALGDPLAAYKLGCYYDGQGEGLVADDPVEALKWKLIAARAGYALAQQDVAVHYALQGNAADAVIWLQRSAAQGWTGALSTMASVYNGATDIPKDPAITAAYFKLYLARVEASPKQRDWLRDFEAKLSAREKAKAKFLVDGYRPQPTLLTIKALSGQHAAEVLVAARK